MSTVINSCTPGTKCECAVESPIRQVCVPVTAENYFQNNCTIIPEVIKCTTPVIQVPTLADGAMVALALITCACAAYAIRLVQNNHYGIFKK